MGTAADPAYRCYSRMARANRCRAVDAATHEYDRRGSEWLCRSGTVELDVRRPRHDYRLRWLLVNSASYGEATSVYLDVARPDIVQMFARSRA